jgi:hypothetical protein
VELLFAIAVIAFLLHSVSRSKTGPPSATSPRRPPPGAAAPPRSTPVSQPTTTPRYAPPIAGPIATPPPPSLRFEPLLSSLSFLRYELGGDWSGVLEPFSVNPKDALDVNRAVKRLAEHAGLRSGLQFIVGIGRLEPDKGGVIELQMDQQEVYIDVASSAGAFGPSLLAVLAHEISHKVLFDHRIRQEGDDLLRFEILTDVTAIYLGFGKLLLNGYEYRTTRHDLTTSAIENQHVRFGYVTIDEVAFVHAMASRMREVPPSGLLDGLSPFARNAMIRVIEDDAVRRHLDTAPMLIPQRTYLSPPTPARNVRATQPRATSQQTASGQQGTTTTAPGRPKPSTKGMSPEARRLRDRLLELVYGDERLASRLVAFEQAHRVTLEASYEAAIQRLIRDRA